MHIKSHLVLLMAFFGFGSATVAQNSTDEDHILTVMRMIGHELLLDSGDSTSRVMPIEKSEEHYLISFSEDFNFESNVLSATINKLMTEQNVSDHFHVMVQQCETKAILYSYEYIEEDTTSLIPCGTRATPKDCYNILINVLDSDIEIVQESEEADVSKHQTVIPWLLAGGFLLFLPVIIHKIRQKRSKQLVDTGIIAIGKYRFDKRNLTLSFGKESIDLTSKEADLLYLLYKSANNTIEREAILRVVWGDEGAYVGRTLDVFISKLRKKLEADDAIKILNVRGVGYKLIMG